MKRRRIGKPDGSEQQHTLESIERVQRKDGHFHSLTHGEVGETSSPLDAKGAAKENDNPDKSAETNVPADNSCGSSIVAKSTSANDIVDEVIDGLARIVVFVIPGAATERVEKGIDDPGNEDYIVGVEHETTCDRTETNSSQTRVEASKDTNISSLEELTKPNLEDGQRNPNKEEGQKVGNEEGTASIVHRQTGETPDITY
jgi:hypothetical protein